MAIFLRFSLKSCNGALQELSDNLIGFENGICETEIYC